MTSEAEPTLARRLSLPLLTLYGVGTMVGGGFYALIGQVAGLAGGAVPVALVLSALIAYLSARSFGELARRFPASAGPARYVLAAFGSQGLGTVVGWLVIATGIVSAATLARAFAGFAAELAAVPEPLSVALVVALLVAVAAWGIKQTVGLAVAITAIEVGGLLWVVWIARDGLAELPVRADELLPDLDAGALLGVVLGAHLAFYAFVGFEDLVTMAEEVRDVERTLPRAILLSLAITTVLYIAVAAAAVLALPLDVLTSSRSPLAAIAAHHGGPAWPLTAVGMLAGVNGALVQIVMASRVIYGLAGQGGAPAWLAAIHPARRTPVRGTVAVGLTVLVLAFGFPLVGLAKATATVLLLVFSLVNLALARIVVREGEARRAVLPGLGVVLSLGLVAAEIWRNLAP